MKSVYFKEKEFLCPCCGQGEVSQRLVDILDTIRCGIGRPIKITSGWRCEEHNKAIGGETDSMHLIGLAADIVCTDTVLRYLIVQIGVRAGITGVGMGKDFLHLDIRAGAKVIWLYATPA